MAIKWDDPEEEPGITEQALGAVSNFANEINYGLAQTFGLQPVLSKLGIGTDRSAPGENPTGAQGAGRMMGMALGAGAAMIAAPLAAAGRANVAANALATSTKALEAGVRPAVVSFLNQTAETAVRNPGVFGSVEAISAAGAGFAGQEVYNQTGSEGGRMLAEIGAGVTLGGLVPLVPKMLNISPTLQLGRSIIRNIMSDGAAAGSTKAGRDAAKSRLKGVAEDPNRAVKEADKIDALPGLSFAAKSGDQGLLSLEKAVIDSSEKLSEQYKQKFAQINAESRKALTEIEAGQGTMDDARRYLDELINDRINIAGLKTEERLSAISPAVRREEANIYARQELNDAYKEAGKQEDVLWGKVPKDLVGEIPNTSSAYRTILDDIQQDPTLKATMSEDLPGVLGVVLGKYNKKGEWIKGTLGDAPTMGQMKNLRSKLLAEISAQRAMEAPNRRRIANLSKLESAILEDMEALAPLDKSLQLARGYSADIAKRFRQGTVGEILGFERTGEGRVAEILTLERALGRSGMPAAQAVDELLFSMERTGNPQAMRDNIEAILSDEFLRASRATGDFNPTSATRWLTRRQDVLKRFPDLARRLENAATTGEAGAVAAKMKDPDIATAELIIRNPVKSALNSVKPEEAVNSAMRLLKDSPEGLAGYKKAFINHILDSATEGTRLDVKDQPILSGPRLNEILNDPGMSAAIGQLFTPDQIKMLERVRTTSLRLYRQQRAKATPETLSANESIWSRAVRNIASASIGRHVTKATGSGGNVQIPGIFVRLGNELAERGLDPARTVIMDAVTNTDETLIRALLSEPLTIKQKAANARRLNAWALGVAQQYGLDLSQSEDPDKLAQRNQMVLKKWDEQNQ